MNPLEQKFLAPSGWIRSRDRGAPMNPEGAPLPWFTYAAIEFLERVVRYTDRVFEFGAGWSTHWWAQRVRDVTSVEHDSEWVATLRADLPHNARLVEIPAESTVERSLPSEVEGFFRRDRRTNWPYDEAKVVRRGLNDERFIGYATRIQKADPSNRGYDFIVVDGMARRLCVWSALGHVSADGFLILDNSNRSDYDLAYELLDEAGFKQIPFWGLVPGAPFQTCTSVFTRSIRRLPSGAFRANTLGLPEY